MPAFLKILKRKDGHFNIRKGLFRRKMRVKYNKRQIIKEKVRDLVPVMK